MRSTPEREAFLTLLHLLSDNLVRPQQIHGMKMHAVVRDDGGREITGVDGLVHQYKRTTPVALGVHVADCIPLLMIDPNTHVVAAIHAGWRGTLGEIALRGIEAMRQLGARPKNILVAIGPHIGMCCYDVPEERARRFENAFDKDPRVASYFDGAWHVDLAAANVVQLEACGVPPAHIDAAPSCTSCQVNEFFSYRKDSKETFGEMMGIIGYC